MPLDRGADVEGAAEPEITGEVTLDEKGRVRQMSILGVQRPTTEEREKFDLEDADELSVELHLTADDIDEEVGVEVPDAAEVVDIADAPEMAAIPETRGRPLTSATLSDPAIGPTVSGIAPPVAALRLHRR